MHVLALFFSVMLYVITRRYIYMYVLVVLISVFLYVFSGNITENNKAKTYI
jgi:hypothetical protein